MRQSRAALLGFFAVVVCGTALYAGVTVLTRPADARSAMASGKYRDAVSFYSAAADKEDPRAMTALGNLHYLGLGTERDHRRAAELYFAAARMGHAPAQINLGNLYAQGLGVTTNELRAFAWYNMASIHGSPAAEYYLNQIILEYTLSPLQRSTSAERWRTLPLLVAEGL